MLDINLIRNEPDKVKEGVLKKGTDSKMVDRFLRVDEEWRKKTNGLNNLRAEQNELNKEIKNSGAKPELISKAQVIKKRVSEVEEEKRKLEEKRFDLLEKLPNLPFDKVPLGKDENSNKIIKEAGKKPEFGFEPKNYLSLAENLGIIDVKNASKVSGSRFGYLIGDAALLEFALIRMVFDEVLSKGFIPVIPPVVARLDVMIKMGKGKFIEDKDAFYINEDDLYLVGSAEHTIGPFHMDHVFKEKDLPRRYVGFSTCFRREAGSYGKDTKGILRVHQFDKVELFSFSKPENSEKEHEFLVSIQEELVKKLKLPYRLVEICSGDMGWADARQFDIEVWFPSEGKYRETHSASNTTDFQARGINACYQSGNDKECVHMLNATAFAIGRTIAAVIENHQTKKGTVKIPVALKKYIGKPEIV